MIIFGLGMLFLPAFRELNANYSFSYCFAWSVLLLSSCALLPLYHSKQITDGKQNSESRRKSHAMHLSSSPFLAEGSVSLSMRSDTVAYPNKPPVYVFVGSLFADHDWYRILFSVVIGGVGLAYCVLEFIPSIEPPANMREADGGWGAEQV